MPDPVKPPRAPDYARRRRRAETTRIRMLDAARTLFLERGYVATTVDAIATAADVAPETVYATFGSKRSVLAAVVDVSISGDDARPLLEQDWVEALRLESDAQQRILILARQGTSILDRRHAIDEVVRGAAASDPEIAALRERGKDQRRAGQLALLRLVAGATGLRPDLDIETAADTLYAIGSPETYRLLVVDRGWSVSRFERWYADTIARLLVDPSP